MDTVGPQIARSSGPLFLEGIRALCLESLVTSLRSVGVHSPVVGADLTLGAWHGHQVATEFCLQLNLPLLSSPQAMSVMERLGATETPLPYADIVGSWIDSEARGNLTILTALTYATHVLNAVDTGPAQTFLIVAPRKGIPWEPENMQFVRFLVQGLQHRPHRLLLVCTEDEEPTLPPDWQVRWQNLSPSVLPVPTASPKLLVGLHPGVLVSEVHAALTKTEHTESIAFLPLQNDYALIAPEYRQWARHASCLDYDRLALRVRSWGWLASYAQFFGNNLYVDPLWLGKEAWQRLAEGGAEIGLRLMERAVGCAQTLIQRGILGSQVQAMRIGLQRFAEAAAEPDPSPALPLTLTGSLCQSKGWGLVMGETPALANPYFNRAQKVLASYYGAGREYLYLLNISALGRLEAGDLDGALLLEKEIEARAAAQPEHDWHLQYINSINLARVCRRLGDNMQAEHYYQRAFATTLGVRSESDRVYTNVCQAQMHTRQGRYAAAFFAWLRASLHWAASSAPEALAPRVVKALLGKTPAVTNEIVESVSAALFALLRDAAVQSEIAVLTAAVPALRGESSSPPVFVQSGEITDQTAFATLTGAVGGTGWSVFCGPLGARRQFTGDNFCRLQMLVHKLLGLLCPQDVLTKAQTLVVDDQYGCEIPGSKHELLAACLRLGAPKLIFAGETCHYATADYRELEEQLRVVVGPAVAQVDRNGEGATVTFKRYLAAKLLSVEESHMVSLLETSLSLRELWERDAGVFTWEHFKLMIRSLESDRVLTLSLNQPTGD